MKKNNSKLYILFLVGIFSVLSCLSACQSTKQTLQQDSSNKNSSENNSENNYFSQIRSFQEEMNSSYKNAKESPLEESERKKFKYLPFFKINESYKIEADFVRTTDGKPFEMQTTTDRKPIYQKFGAVSFELQGKKHTLNVYQSQDLKQKEEYKNYLFLPFTDLSNGDESYYGGRYIDLQVAELSNGQEINKIMIDFNKAYNPYCAYNKKYSCPIPPRENHLEIKVLAGVKY